MIDDLTNKTNYLINKLATDDSEEALEGLYQLYFHKLVRFIYMYIQSYRVVEEIISDVFCPFGKTAGSWYISRTSMHTC